MTIATDIRLYLRFAWGLRHYLRHTITLEEAEATVRERLAHREANFLRVVERGIFGCAHSPYLSLFKWAGCKLGDVQHLVSKDGLEATLRALHEAGVYVTFEEFKGRQPIVRGGRTLAVQPHDFDSPHLRHYIEGQTGGTSGVATRLAIDLEHRAAQAPEVMLGYQAHDLLYAPMALWCPILPGVAGMNTILNAAPFRYVPSKWFTPVTAASLRPALKYRIATHYVLILGRLLGLPLPFAEAVPLDQAGVVAHWAANASRTDGRCVVRAHVSTAVRVCVAAQHEGLELSGVTFVGGGEPPTPAKVRQITGTGARWVSNYFAAEVGGIGWGCARPADSNDSHFLKDRLALIQRPHRVPETYVTVEAFYITNLLASAPKVLLNVQMDDYGVIEQRACGCPLQSLGLTEHLRHVHSFSKLTSEGMTLVGSQMVRIIEEVLPARFGGSPLDYQLLEQEDEEGFTRLYLLIHPRIALDDESAAIDAVLHALRETSPAADLTQAVWRQAGTLRIKRMEPVWTARGKLTPLHLDRARKPPSRGSPASPSAS